MSESLQLLLSATPERVQEWSRGDRRMRDYAEQCAEIALPDPEHLDWAKWVPVELLETWGKLTWEAKVCAYLVAHNAFITSNE